MLTRLFSLKYRLVILAMVLLCAGVLFSATLKQRGVFGHSPISIEAAQAPVNNSGKEEEPTLKRIDLWPQLGEALSAHGDRLERPGKERVFMQGTYSDTDKGGQPILVQITMQLPNLLRVEDQEGKKLVFDGEKHGNAKRVSESDDENLIEWLTSDTVENLFSNVAIGKGVRYLGAHFREENPADPKGQPFLYDIYELSETLRFKREQVTRSKFFLLNSYTQRLEKARYRSADNFRNTDVEIRLGGWRNVDGQKLPLQLSRWENGQLKQSLKIDNLGFSKRQNDAVFTVPRN